MNARLLLCLVFAAFSVRTVSAQDDQIKALIEKYTQSIDGVDTALAGQVWSTGTDVSLIHPMGHERGWEQIKANFYENVMGKMFTKRELKPKDIAIHILGETAWVEFNWEFTGTMTGSNQQVNTKGRETQVLKKTAQGWRIVHVHYSIPFTPPGQ